MGSSGGLGGSDNASIATKTKKRSVLSRQRLSDPTKLLHSYADLLPRSQVLGGAGGGVGENGYYGGLGGESRPPKKLKLKLGGVTHTIQAKIAPDHAFGSSFEKDSTYRAKLSGHSVNGNHPNGYDPVRKSKRVPKRRAMDVGYNEEEDGADEEIRFLGRFNSSSVSDKDGRKKLRLDKFYEDNDYMEEEEPTSGDDLVYKSKRLGSIEERGESTIAAINGNLKSAKDFSLRSGGATQIEYPNGLPSPPSKKKTKLTELEQQVKRAEAAQRRKMQSEKADREAQAEAIRKILGQDSARKKKEENVKKQRDELAQANAVLRSNTVRCLISPTGTVVTFSEDIGLPSILKSAPCSYPPPREKCAGPNCTNTYKYRDSKSNLPLCSLQCYKAIHKRQSVITC